MRRLLLALTPALLSSVPSATHAASNPSFVPVLRTNFPDAFVLRHGTEFIAYATNDGANVPIAVSPDLVHWTVQRSTANPTKKYDALPALGSWAKSGFTWAPEVIASGNQWLLYYTASSRQLNMQCIGVATANDPKGPFTDASNDPVVCQAKLGGTIDASPFRDSDGQLYLYFKNDGNRVHQRTSLWAQRLSADGRSAVGEPVALVGDRERWKEQVIEAPTMVRSPGGYTLFYSGGFFGWRPEEGGLSPYGMGYASCAGPLGPCTDSPSNPILHSFKDRDAGCLSGPGHQSVFSVGDRMFISFHAWAATSACRKADDRRELYIAPLHWEGSKPVLGISLRDQQPATR